MFNFGMIEVMLYDTGFVKQRYWTVVFADWTQWLVIEGIDENSVIESTEAFEHDWHN